MTAEACVLARLLADDPDWASRAPWSPAALVSAARDHGVSALVWQALADSTGRAAQVRDALAAQVRAAAAQDLFVQREMQSVLSALAGAGVRALVVKGSALAYTVYARPWLRPRTDTDLLVCDNDVEAASRVLASCGYARSDALTSGTLVSHQVAFEHVDRHGVHHVIDLHWKIVNPQLLADSLSFDELWRDSHPAAPLGPSARVPSSAASVAIASIHRLAHHQGRQRLVWLVDFRLLTERFETADWQALENLARRSRVAGLCLEGLRQARDLVGARLPESVETALSRSAPTEPSRVYLERTVRKRDVLASDLIVLRSWRSRLRLLREHAFPPPAFIRQRYGKGNRWPLPALYLHRLVTGAVRWVRP